MRILRAGIAIWAFVELYRTGEWLLLIPGILFGLQAVLNVSTCGSGACYVPPKPVAGEGKESVVYEEVR